MAAKVKAKGFPVARLRRVSGNAIGRNSKRILGCENCNFMQLHSPPPKSKLPASPPLPSTSTSTNSPSQPVTMSTGDKCPRCNLPCLRVYDSQAEFGRAQELKLARNSGLITDLQFQVPFALHAISPDGKKVHLYKYVSDFTYYIPPSRSAPDAKPVYIVEDVKPKGGLVTDVFMMKKKHFEAEYGIDITIVER